jgi:G patch domain-containing protein 1
MDEEDMREAEESRTLATSDKFAGFGTEQDAMRKSAAIDIFRPPGETIGSKLLKKMGWREGSGVGPRVRRTANLGGEDGDETTETHLFAPDDVQVVYYPRKNDYKGLGYEGDSHDPENTANQRTTIPKSARTARPLGNDDDGEGVGPLFTVKKSSTSVRKRTGIGTGVLNDDGSDDEDPYSMGPKISYNKTIGGEKKGKSKSQSISSSSNPLLKNKPTFISKRLANLKGALRKCHDGRLPLDGFVLANELGTFGTMSLQDDKCKPLPVPEGWVSSISPDTETDSASSFVSTADAAKASNLTAKGRALLLGESQLPGKSVFDFLTPAARDRLVAASGQQNLPPAGNEAAPNGQEASESAADALKRLVPRLDREIAIQALNRGVSGWVPYADEEGKRSRYRTYLEIQAGLRAADEIPPRAERMRQDDWVLELHEFARAAEVFKPISGLMASRFTTSSSALQGSDENSGNESGDLLLSKPKPKPEDPAEAASKLGMFGPMTRSVINFYPTRLLCKRFGVPMPTHADIGKSEPGVGCSSGGSGSSIGATQFRSFASAGFQHDEASEVNGKDSKKLADQPPAPSPLHREVPDVDPDRNEALEQERPSQAVFKAIFGSDEEDD